VVRGSSPKIFRRFAPDNSAPRAGPRALKIPSEGPRDGRSPGAAGVPSDWPGNRRALGVPKPGTRLLGKARSPGRASSGYPDLLEVGIGFPTGRRIKLDSKGFS